MIAAPLDALGINYYTPTRIQAPTSEGLPCEEAPIEGYRRTAFGWPVVPDGLRELLVGLKERYPALPPVYLTENGCSVDDVVTADGTV
ncbi:family 1 glycosylhydrolase, partial [Nonomuraea montanisoli]|uniref:family 1 glycosylhydrolase n=1 Tax=Nonomuraea montanisoli TaxID=2741721 RepID=UPI001F30015E